jgi:hypothetical protein
MIRIKIHTLLLLGFLVSSCFTLQYISGDYDNLERDQILIINETGEIHSLLIGSDVENLHELKIGAGETWLSPPFSNRPYIRIMGETWQEDYLLTTGRPYQLYWNGRKNRLDIKIAEPN